jgi:hypothetical protein
MPSTHKKVVVRKMDRDTINGYVAPANFVHEGKLELLNTSGNVVGIELRDIKGVYFVREFENSDSLTRKTFTTRPRTEGLWVRLRFKDGEVLEGMMPNDLMQNIYDGYLVTPPDLRSNTQRIFIPRSALESLTVLAVIGAARRRREGLPGDTRQVTMFGELEICTRPLACNLKVTFGRLAAATALADQVQSPEFPRLVIAKGFLREYFAAIRPPASSFLSLRNSRTDRRLRWRLGL